MIFGRVIFADMTSNVVPLRDREPEGDEESIAGVQAGAHKTAGLSGVRRRGRTLRGPAAPPKTRRGSPSWKGVREREGRK